MLLAGGCLLLSLLASDLALRALVQPSDRCFGELFGKRLPPYEILSQTSKRGHSRDHTVPMTMHGARVTAGDLWGVEREHGVLGYAPKESTRSVHGWWQSNALGARRRTEISSRTPRGMRRILAFGDSFTQCSRVRQEETWPYFWEERNDRLEVVNFGVDGYNLCQAQLRYGELGPELSHDLVVLMFVPRDDLWRDINVYRGLRGWVNYVPTPRYVLEGETLRLVRSPYTSWDAFFEDNREGPSPAFLRHLKTYDRFYFASKFEVPPVLGQSMIYKLTAHVAYTTQRRGIEAGLMRTNSEAFRVSMRVMQRLAAEARTAGAGLAVVFLPTVEDLAAYEEDGEFRRRWEAMVAEIARRGVKTVDLLEDLAAVPRDQIDLADGWHYGPRGNRLIAALLDDELGG